MPISDEFTSRFSPEAAFKIVVPHNVATTGQRIFWDGGSAIAQTPIIGGNAIVAQSGGEYYAFGENGPQLQQRRTIQLFRSNPQQVSEEILVAPTGASIVYLFATCEWSRDAGFNLSYQWRFFLTNGTNTLMVRECDVFVDGATSRTDNVLGDYFAYVPQNYSQWTLVDANTIVFQLATQDHRDLSNTSSGGGSYKASMYSAIISASTMTVVTDDFQNGLDDGHTMTYPSAFGAYSQYLAAIAKSGSVFTDSTSNFIDIPQVAVDARLANVDFFNASGYTAAYPYINVISESQIYRIEWFPQPPLSEERQFDPDNPQPYAEYFADEPAVFNNILFSVFFYDRQWIIAQPDGTEVVFDATALSFDSVLTSDTTFADSTTVWATVDYREPDPSVIYQTAIQNYKDGLVSRLISDRPINFALSHTQNGNEPSPGDIDAGEIVSQVFWAGVKAIS